MELDGSVGPAGRTRYTADFGRGRRDLSLEPEERARLEAVIVDVRTLPARSVFVTAGRPLTTTTLLLEGFVCRAIRGGDGRRQMVGTHVPGDYFDLHAYPSGTLDHDVVMLSPSTVAVIPDVALDHIIREMPGLTRKLWLSTLLDAAMHRAWLFRVGRLDAPARVAHFFCETNARLIPSGASDGRGFDLPITQVDLADICGLTGVHVNRVLRQLREEELCTFRNGRVEVLDLPGLVRRGRFDPGYLYLDDATERKALG